MAGGRPVGGRIPGSVGIIVGTEDGVAVVGIDVGLPLGSAVGARVGVSVGDGLGESRHGPQFPTPLK